MLGYLHEDLQAMLAVDRWCDRCPSVAASRISLAVSIEVRKPMEYVDRITILGRRKG
jgi:hypothetical protein